MTEEQEVYSCESIVKTIMRKFKLGYDDFDHSKGLTVEALCLYCMMEIAKGNGQKHVQISRDDEGNGFHTLYYGFNKDPDDVNCYDYDDKVDKKKIVCLG